MFNSVYAWEMASCCLSEPGSLVLQFLKSPRFENCRTIGAASSRPSHGSQERRAMRGDGRKTAHLGPRLSPLGQFRGIPLGQLHSGFSGVNKRNISHFNQSFIVSIYLSVIIDNLDKKKIFFVCNVVNQM